MKKILIGYGFVLAFLSITGFSQSSQKISSTQSFKPTEEIIYIAQMSYGIHTGVAMTLPIPTKIGQKVHITVFFYKEGMRPGEEIVYPPHHKITIGAATGNVIENTPVTPKDLGVPKALDAATEGYGLDPAMTSDEFWNLVDRFFEISPIVWEIYKTGLTRPSNQELKVIREYNSIFRRIAKAPLLPYYKAVASNFLEWLSKVLQIDSGDEGVDSSSQDDESIETIRLHAEQGKAESQFNLGLMYYNGYGTSQNCIKAFAWWTLAAAQGNEDARKNCVFLIDTMPPSKSLKLKN